MVQPPRLVGVTHAGLHGFPKGKLMSIAQPRVARVCQTTHACLDRVDRHCLAWGAGQVTIGVHMTHPQRQVDADAPAACVPAKMVSRQKGGGRGREEGGANRWLGG